MLSPGPEILAYFESVAERYGVAAHTRFGDEVVACEFAGGRWHLTTAAGHDDTVDVVDRRHRRPAPPEVPGHRGPRAASPAPCFHSARWDHSVPLSTAPGSGSSARAPPPCRSSSAVVDRRRRTCRCSSAPPNGSCRRPTPPTPTEELAAFREPEALEKLHAELSDMFDLFSTAVVDVDFADVRASSRTPACATSRTMSPTRSCANGSAPTYRAACKRLIVSEDFYEAIQQPNAELVTEHIEHIEPGGIRTADGRLHELDVLVLATGFKVDAFVRPIRVIGRGGLDLDDVWAKRPEAYLAISVPEFPNFFMLNGPNGPVGQLLADRGGRAPARLHHAAGRPPRRPMRGREVCASADGPGRLRGGADRGVEEHRVGHRVRQLVPRRPRHPGGLAVAVQEVPRGDGVAETGTPTSSARRSPELPIAASAAAARRCPPAFDQRVDPGGGGSHHGVGGICQRRAVDLEDPVLPAGGPPADDAHRRSARSPRTSVATRAVNPSSVRQRAAGYPRRHHQQRLTPAGRSATGHAARPGP